jgi:hypothetical protein
MFPNGLCTAQYLHQLSDHFISIYLFPMLPGSSSVSSLDTVKSQYRPEDGRWRINHYVALHCPIEWVVVIGGWCSARFFWLCSPKNSSVMNPGACPAPIMVKTGSNPRCLTPQMFQWIFNDFPIHTFVLFFIQIASKDFQAVWLSIAGRICLYLGLVLLPGLVADI